MKPIIFLLKLIFIYPGMLVLWFQYFFPTKGKQGGFVSIAKSRRQYKEGGMIIAFITSCMFWIMMFFLFIIVKEEGLVEKTKLTETHCETIAVVSSSVSNTDAESDYVIVVATFDSKERAGRQKQDLL